MLGEPLMEAFTTFQKIGSAVVDYLTTPRPPLEVLLTLLFALGLIRAFTMIVAMMFSQPKPKIIRVVEREGQAVEIEEINS